MGPFHIQRHYIILPTASAASGQGGVREVSADEHPARDMTESARETAGAHEELQDYFIRLMRLIPSEIIGLYLIGDGVIPKTASLPPGKVDTTRAIALIVWSIVCLVGLVALRAWGTADNRRKGKPQWVAVSLSAISFLIWLYSIGGPFQEFPGVRVPFIGSLLVLAWTFFVPFFYTGPDDTTDTPAADSGSGVHG